ncbi:glycosyltransferase [Nakamurella endophytica]|uniref:Glycosyltransferase 2-like domain-containing protein n=1 Tax=Nakamurella endophytica TaxID=1748367 RepID=A0A917WAG2_9ACTN|nr:glycosyltransferase [Nakamurella endophytica]GGL87418.1 hypothetical protein GCM10011594_03740 [Nakamurella endophytica]
MSGSVPPTGPVAAGLPAGSPPVVVAMLTYRRPDDLEAAVPAVLEQARAVEPPATLLVVDNDPAGSARQVLQRWAAPDVRYVHEPRPGIAAARNRALDECPDGALLVFIDDDERPRPGWLAALLQTYREHRPAAVVGAVVSEYDAEPDRWIRAGRFFDRRRLLTGTPTDVAATNNLLLDIAVVRRAGLRFDDRFGQSGGSDTLFSRQLSQVGALIWCDEAVVVDRVPVSRLTRSWVLRRAFRSGNSWVRTSVVLAPDARARSAVRLRATGRGAVRTAGGSARLAVGVATRSLAQQARGRRTLARGAGMLAGVWGHVHVEYRRAPEAASDGSAPAGVPTGRPGRLGIVVVNYGSTALLPGALDGLADGVPADVVVVDNWHSAKERAAVAELCADRGWTLVARAGNDGFGTAANAGADVLLGRGCDVLLVLNPDARIGPEQCRQLAERARRQPDALISPRIVRPDGTTWFRGLGLDPRSGRVVRPAEWRSGPHSWLTGACLTASAQLWRRLGGFADGYFLYWEDVDLSTRCVLAGGTLVVADDVVAEHAVGATQQSADGRGRAKSRVYYRYNTRNRLVYAARNLPTRQLLRWLAHTPAESTAILLRGGRRQLLASPGVAVAALRGTSEGVVASLRELLSRARGGARRSRQPTRRVESVRPDRHVRIYGNVRTAHLERLAAMSPAALVYRRHRYDFDPGTAPAGAVLARRGRLATIGHLLRRRYDVVELNEPMAYGRWLDLVAQVAAVRLRGLVTGRRTTVVAYCIGYSDPAVELTERWPALPVRPARALTRIAVRTLSRSMDRLAFGTTGSLELYRRYVPRARGDWQVFEGLSAPCECLADGAGNPSPTGARILFLGAFSDRKGIRQLMQAWDQRGQLPDGACLRLVGKGPLTDLVREWADDRNDVRVEVDPPRAEIHRALRDADVLVLLSQPVRGWREQIGLPILEGLSHGVRIVASDETGLASWLERHGHCVLPADSPPATTLDAILRTARDPRSRESVLADLPHTDQRLAADLWLHAEGNKA